MNSANDRVRQTAALGQAGKKDEARRELVTLVKEDENNAAAWAALAQLADTPKDAAYCLKQILRIQPESDWARTQLQRLSQQESQPQPILQTALSQGVSSQRVPRQLIPVAAGVVALLCLLGGLLVVQAGMLPGMFGRPTGEPAMQTGTLTLKAPASRAAPESATPSMTASPAEPGKETTS